jgi:hypothetical protein
MKVCGWEDFIEILLVWEILNIFLIGNSKRSVFFCLKLFSGPKNGCKRISPKLKLEILHTWEMILGASMIQSYMYSQPIVGVGAD